MASGERKLYSGELRVQASIMFLISRHEQAIPRQDEVLILTYHVIMITNHKINYEQHNKLSIKFINLE